MGKSQEVSEDMVFYSLFKTTADSKIINYT